MATCKGVAAHGVAPTTQGYLPGQLYNLDSKFGNKEQLQELTAALKRAGLRPVADIVVNHRCADQQDENGIWNMFRWAPVQPPLGPPGAIPLGDASGASSTRAPLIRCCLARSPKVAWSKKGYTPGACSVNTCCRRTRYYAVHACGGAQVFHLLDTRETLEMQARWRQSLFLTYSLRTRGAVAGAGMMWSTPAGAWPGASGPSQMTIPSSAAVGPPTAGKTTTPPLVSSPTRCCCSGAQILADIPQQCRCRHLSRHHQLPSWSGAVGWRKPAEAQGSVISCTRVLAAAPWLQSICASTLP